MLEANTNEPTGQRYQDIYGEWLNATGFDQIDKGDRSRLLDCLKHREEIEIWRETLPLNKRLELNHPSSVWRAWQRSTIAPSEPGRMSPVAKYKDAIVRLEEENTRLRRAGDDLFLPQDTATDIARLLADRLLRVSPTKAAEILRLLPELYTKRIRDLDDGTVESAQAKARQPRREKRRAIEDFQCDLAQRREGAGAAP
jgi:hypothetical protein